MLKKFKVALAEVGEDVKLNPTFINLNASVNQFAASTISALNRDSKNNESGDTISDLENLEPLTTMSTKDVFSLSDDVIEKRRRLSETSDIFPIYEENHFPHLPTYDLDSTAGSEWGDSESSSVSKEHLCQILSKTKLRYHKYKGRYSEASKAFAYLQAENGKIKDVMQETQDKALRRISELKEQCSLEQRAKRHLEEELRSDIEEKDHIIKALQTKVSLLKSSPEAMRSAQSLDLTSPDEKKNQSDLEEKVKRLENLLTKCKESITTNKIKTSALHDVKESLSKQLEEKENENETLRIAYKKVEMDLNTLRNNEELQLAESKLLMHQREKALTEAEFKKVLAEKEEQNKLAIEEIELRSKALVFENEQKTMLLKDLESKLQSHQREQEALEVKSNGYKVELEALVSQKEKFFELDSENRLRNKNLEKEIYSLKEQLELCMIQQTWKEINEKDNDDKNALISQSEMKEGFHEKEIEEWKEIHNGLLKEIQFLQDQHKNETNANLLSYTQEQEKNTCLIQSLEKDNEKLSLENRGLKEKNLYFENELKTCESLHKEKETNWTMSTQKETREANEKYEKLKLEMTSFKEKTLKENSTILLSHEITCKENEKLINQINTLESTLRCKEENLIEVETNYRQITEGVVRENEQYKEKIMVLEENLKYNLDTKDRISSLEVENEQYKEKIMVLEENLNHNLDYKDRISSLEVENEQYKEKIMVLEENQKHNLDYKDRISSLEVENEQYKEKIMVLEENQKHNLDTKNRISCLEVENEKYKEKIMVLEENLKHNLDTKDRISSLEIELALLASQVQENEGRENEWISENTKLKKAIETFENENKTQSERDNEVKNKRIEDLENEVSRLNDSISLNSESDKYSLEVALESSSSVFCEENEDLEERLSNKWTRMESMKKENEDYKKRILLLEEKYNLQTIKNKSLQESLENEIKIFKCSLSSKENENSELLFKLKEINVSLQELKGGIDDDVIQILSPQQHSSSSLIYQDSKSIVSQSQDSEPLEPIGEKAIENYWNNDWDHDLDIDDFQNSSPALLKLNNQFASYGSHRLEEAAEFEYLKNILYQYMIGKESLTLAKVLAAVVKFDADQINNILSHEEQKHSVFPL